MPVFAVTYAYDPSADLDEVRPAHRAYLQTLAERGLLVASGPYVGVESPGALLVFNADDEAAVRALLDDDPFRHHDMVASATITGWNPVIGRLSDLT